jgi:hypothetical protein
MDPPWSPLIQAVKDDDLPAVQRLLASRDALVTDRTEGGMNAAHLAAGLGHFRLLEWLLTEGGANVLEVDNRGRDVWKKLKYFSDLAKLDGVVLKQAKDEELASLLRVMSLLSDAQPIEGSMHPPFLKPHHARIIAQGQRLRAHFPAYLDQQRALLAQHIPLPTVL